MKSEGEDLHPPSLENAILEAIAHNSAELEKAKHRGVFRSPSFACISMLKRHPSLEGASADEAAELIRPYLERLASPGECAWSTLGRFDSFGREVADLEADFMAVWIKYAPHPLEEAVRKADSWPVRDAWLDRQSPGLRRFASVVSHLNEARPGAPIPISVAAFCEALGCDAKSISNYNFRLIDKGLLRKEREHSRCEKRASEFRWLGPPPRRYCPKCEGRGSHYMGPHDVRRTCLACHGSGVQD